ncbi:Short-chain dehydrogenase/reductase SDR [Trinorchestia longiramus]|nr:Short-chain dehydrogenase/reductase SDR [Trinorchestia longiramus]
MAVGKMQKHSDAGVTGGVLCALQTFLKIVAVLPFSIAYVLDSTYRTLLPRRFKKRSVKGETVLITGGGSGLGRELAVRFGRAGAHVIVWGRNTQNLEKTRELVLSQRGHCSIYQVDVTDRATVYSTATEIKEEFGMVDILINNAGVVYGKNILDSKDEDICNTFNVNIISHFYTTKAFLPEMVQKNKGQVVTVSSMGGYQAINKMTDYCASKFAAVGYNEALTMELRANGSSGVSTTLVCPYYVDTGMFSGVKSKLVPVLSPEFVADETFDAILMKNRYCILPWYCSLTIFLGTFVPEKLQYLLLSISGLTEGLSEFRGRHQRA